MQGSEIKSSLSNLGIKTPSKVQPVAQDINLIESEEIHHDTSIIKYFVLILVLALLAIIGWIMHTNDLFKTIYQNIKSSLFDDKDKAEKHKLDFMQMQTININNSAIENMPDIPSSYD